jgi:hypothetical protein
MDAKIRMTNVWACIFVYEIHMHAVVYVSHCFYDAIIKMNMLLWLLYHLLKKQKQILNVSVCLVLKVQ